MTLTTVLQWFNLSWTDRDKRKAEAERVAADQQLRAQMRDQRHEIACEISPILTELQMNPQLKERVGSDAVDEWLKTRAEVHACLKNYLPAQQPRPAGVADRAGVCH